MDVQKVAELSAVISSTQAGMANLAKYVEGMQAPLTGRIEVLVPAGTNTDGSNRPPNEPQTIDVCLMPDRTPRNLSADEAAVLYAAYKGILQKRLDTANTDLQAAITAPAPATDPAPAAQ